MTFNENTRVKIPALLHSCSLGYTYLPLSKTTWNVSNNIFTDIFVGSMQRINPEMDQTDIKNLLETIDLALDNEDQGKSFYEMLVSGSSQIIIDFEHFENNSLHVVTELPCKNGEEEFRPDITLLINGLPLVFIEVKKPNNLEGIQAEYKRIQSRFKNKKFRKFINITQLMVFSNNMEYADDGSQPLQGAFYATTSYGKVNFNYFREVDQFDLANLLTPVSDELGTDILQDNNLISIKHAQEFLYNKHPDTPIHRIYTSLFEPKRLSFVLKYTIDIKTENGLQKYIMRYPQIFATKAIERNLNEGIRKGIIKHAQGNGTGGTL